MIDIEAHKTAYAIVVEEVIVELLETSGVDKLPGDNLMENLYQLGGEIHRHVITPNYNEFISLIMGGVITHVGHVFVKDDSIAHIVMTADEMKEAQQNGTK